MQADEGIIYGVRLALCDPTGDFLYYFGRTRNPALVGATYDGGEFLPADHVRLNRKMCNLLKRCGRTGMNAASHVVLFRRSSNVIRDFRVFLNRLHDQPDDVWLNSEPMLGAHYFSSEYPPYCAQEFTRILYNRLLQGEQDPELDLTPDMTMVPTYDS